MAIYAWINFQALIVTKTAFKIFIIKVSLQNISVFLSRSSQEAHFNLLKLYMFFQAISGAGISWKPSTSARLLKFLSTRSRYFSS